MATRFFWLFLVLVFVLSGCGSDIRCVLDPEDDRLDVPDLPPVVDTGGAENVFPPAEDRTLTFLFFSDMQADPETGDYTATGELLAGATSGVEWLSLVLIGGDTVNDGGNIDEWNDFWQAAGSSFDGLITAAVPGNHDNYALLSGQFDHPSEAPQMPGEGFFYTFSSGPVFFLMLDSNIMGSANQRDIDWLQHELQSEAATQADWRIVVMHHPMWPLTDHPRDIQRAATLREFFLPLFEEYGVDLLLCGHQHVYSRSLPMSGDSQTADGQGIVQIMAASGDKASYTIGERDFVAASGTAPNYLLVNVDESELIIKAYNSEHLEIDEVRISKND